MTLKPLLYYVFVAVCSPLIACSNGHAEHHHGEDGHTHDDEAAHAQAHYLANSAILISQGETKILFDPLFHNNFGQYQLVPDEVRAKIMAGIEAFEGVDAVFISHAHGDHFNAGDANQYMESQAGARFIAPQQAVDAMQKDSRWNDDFISRIIAVDLDYGDAPQEIAFGDITASAVRIPHAGWPDPRRVAVQNIVYRVSINGSGDEGATVMHMGDADPRAQHYTPYDEHWQTAQTDTAFPPYWFFLSQNGVDIINNQLNVKEAVGVHVPSTVPEKLKASGADYFSTPGEEREIKK